MVHLSTLFLRLIIRENIEENMPKLLCPYNQEKLFGTGCKNPHVFLKRRKELTMAVTCELG